MKGRDLLIAFAPGLVMLALFYSLAIHMFHALGGWPKSIGERGFPASLLVHCSMAVWYCEAFVLMAIFAAPAALVVSLAVGKWRRVTPYLGVGLIFAAVSWGLMMLAPAPFLNWWWD
jgi:hypothetical protein